jgi:uncharacterized protein (DUF433 family)
VSRYPLNLPTQLKQEAEQWASKQGVSLNQIILWAGAEKIGELKQQLDDLEFPQITYRRGAAGRPVPVVRGAGIRVQTIVVANQDWELSAEQIATEYNLNRAQVKEALAFYEAHREEIEIDLAAEQSLEAKRG